MSASGGGVLLSNAASDLIHRRTHCPETYVRRPWLMEFFKLGYLFHVHAWLPLCVVMNWPS